MEQIEEEDDDGEGGDLAQKRRRKKKKKKIVEVYMEPTDKDILMAKAYGGVPKPTKVVKKVVIKPNSRNIQTPSNIGVRDQTKEKL